MEWARRDLVVFGRSWSWVVESVRDKDCVAGSLLWSGVSVGNVSCAQHYCPLLDRLESTLKVNLFFGISKNQLWVPSLWIRFWTLRSLFFNFLWLPPTCIWCRHQVDLPFNPSTSPWTSAGRHPMTLHWPCSSALALSYRGLWGTGYLWHNGPLKTGRSPKGNLLYHLPIIDFSGAILSFRENEELTNSQRNWWILQFFLRIQGFHG